jgi:hypothetical protein
MDHVPLSLRGANATKQSRSNWRARRDRDCFVAGAPRNDRGDCLVAFGVRHGGLGIASSLALLAMTGFGARHDGREIASSQ